MKRRAFVAGLFVLASGSSGLVGYRAGSRQAAIERFDFRAFLRANSDVTFQYMPAELMLKLYSRSLAEADRMDIVRSLARPNAAFFVVAPFTRTLGAPGFYRVAA